MSNNSTTFKPGDFITFVIDESGKRLNGRVTAVDSNGYPRIYTQAHLRQGQYPKDIQPVPLPAPVEPPKGIFLIFGLRSSSQAAHELKRDNPEKYAELRKLAIKLGLISA